MPPGETRLVDETLIIKTVSHSEPEGQEDGDDKNAAGPDREELAALLKNQQKDVLEAMSDLSFAELEMLGDLEQEGQARKGILGAVAERLLESAAGQQ